MPSKSPEQAQLMRAIAHGWKPDRIKGPSRKVAKEFVAADKKVKGYQQGGPSRFSEQAAAHQARIRAILGTGAPQPVESGNVVAGGTQGFYQRPENQPVWVGQPAQGPAQEPAADPFAFRQEQQEQRVEEAEQAAENIPVEEVQVGRRSPDYQPPQEQTGNWGLDLAAGEPIKVSEGSAMARRQRQVLRDAGWVDGGGGWWYPLEETIVGQARGGYMEPVEMQYGGGLGQYTQRAGGFPGGAGGGMPPRQMMQQQRGRGRQMPGGARGMMQRGRRGRGRGMPQQAMKGLGRTVGAGTRPPVRPGGPSGQVPGRQFMGDPGGGGTPGIPPSMRGHLQKMRAQQRTTSGGNRIGMRDQQGGLARAMQTQTGRPPISRRAAFPGSRQNQY